MNRHHVITWDASGASAMHLEFDAAGDLVRLSPAGSGQTWLTRFAPLVTGATGNATRLRADVRCEVDADEVEQRWDVPGTDLRVRVRHTFDRTWQMRVMVRNSGSEPTEARLRWEAGRGPDAQLGIHAAGGHASCRVAGSTPGAEILQGMLVAGAVGPGAATRMRVEPGGTSVTTWKFDWADPTSPPPLPTWWPRTDLDADDPVVICDADLVVVNATSSEQGWELPAAPGVRRVEVVEATRVGIVEIFGAPRAESLAQDLCPGLDERADLAPAEAMLLVQAGRPVGDIRPRLRIGDDEPGLRRLLGGPGEEACLAPGFGHGIATLHELAMGRRVPTLPPVTDNASDVELADRMLLSAPDMPWLELMAGLGPVMGAWPMQPWGWGLAEIARWVAVASLARHLGRPGVPDPEPLRRLVLARCHDEPPPTRVAALVWLSIS